METMNTDITKEQIIAEVQAFDARVAAHNAAFDKIKDVPEDEWKEARRKLKLEHPLNKPVFMMVDPRGPWTLGSHYLADQEKFKSVVFQEKHGERHYLIKPWDVFAFGRIALEVIKDREDWHLYELADYDKELASAPAKPFEDNYIDSLPNDELKNIAKKQMESYKWHINRLEEIAGRKKQLIAALEGNLLAASRFIQGTREAQYEKFQVDVLREV